MSTSILRAVTRVLTPLIVLLALLLLGRGHDAPGGGFIGALAAGAAAVLQYLAHGARGLRRLVPFEPGTLLAAGLGIALSFGLAGLVFGQSFLQGAVWRPVVLGAEVKIAASVVFDLGVFLVVVGVVVSFLRSLGEDEG